MTRHLRLRRWLAHYGLTDHALAHALAVPLPKVHRALAGVEWFTPATERRLVQFLEVGRTEWEPLE